MTRVVAALPVSLNRTARARENKNRARESI